MKLMFLIFSMVFIFTQNIVAQITVGQNDMPSAGDTIYYGTSNVSNFDPLLTGPSYTWDYSNFNALTHRADTFLTIAQTPIVYNVVFNLLIANLACINQSPPSLGVGITVSDYYDFLKKSSSGYKKIGFGASINGINTPVKYDSPELYYTFPLHYNDVDSSTSSYGMTIPTYGYYGQTIKRKYLVDGWGTLIIPYGTFPVLRVKVTLNVSDTIFFENFQFGQNITRPVSYEYYWIANNLNGHALKISKNGMLNTAEYLDSLTYTNVNISHLEPEVKMYPSPATDKVFFDLDGTEYNISINNLMGEMVFHAKTSDKLFAIKTEQFPVGLYIVEVQNKLHRYTMKLVVIK